MVRQQRAVYFPGGKYGGSVTDSEESEDLKWYVAQGDKAAWDDFIAKNSSTWSYLLVSFDSR